MRTRPRGNYRQKLFQKLTQRRGCPNDEQQNDTLNLFEKVTFSGSDKRLIQCDLQFHKQEGIIWDFSLTMYRFLTHAMFFWDASEYKHIRT